MANPFECPYCFRTLKSERGVTQHIFQTPACQQKQKEEVSTVHAHAKAQPSELTEVRRSKRLQLPPNDVAERSPFASGNIPPEVPDQEADDMYQAPDDDADSADQTDLPLKNTNRGGSRASDDSESSSEEETAAGMVKLEPNTEILQKFRSYCEEHHHNYLGLTKEERTCIKLMDVLRRKAPLNAYELVLEWHLKETGILRQHEKLGDVENYHHRKTLIKHLLPRYNLNDMMPKEKRVKLPSSKAVVSIPVREAADCIVSLLTDPRFEDSDYLFFQDDPLAPPPEKVTHLADLNTGEAYLKTYEKMITHNRQVLLAVPIYIDGAVTGQFTDLPITAVKLSLGIHRRETRDKPHAWRELGYIPVVRKDPARGKKIFQDTGHLESQDVIVLEGEGEAASEDDAEQEDDESEDGAVKAQDFHTMLKTILASFVELQRTGFIWDLVYKGKLYRGVEFVIFVPFVKCDTEEAEVLCGKYTVRTKNVKHVCRYCHCPTSEADNPLAKYRLKTQPEIQNMVERGQLDRLQQISQQYIENAWYDVSFHKANDAGIHGACPSEKLHAIQLGVFKYLREIFFVHMGKTSQLAETINGLATMYGKLLTRQSERDLPNTNFAKGIQKGKLMARDFRGVLLIMAAVLRSKKGRELLFKRKKFGGEDGLRDWTLLVELMLEWEAYLCEKRMVKQHVVRLAKKHRFIMYVMKNVAQRSDGMGLKLMKFHAIVHLIQDIILYGVPTEFDTGSNESHHKESKYAAKLTQRKESSFNFQTAKRLVEFLCIDLGMEEVMNDRCVWEYFDAALEEYMDADEMEVDAEFDACLDGGDSDDTEAEVVNSDSEDADSAGEDSDLEEEEDIAIQTGGTRIKIFEDPDQDGNPSFEILSRSKTQKKTVWLEEVVVFLNNLQNLVLDYIPTHFLPVMTCHQRGSNKFYGHPNFRSSGPWKDWVLVDWGDYGVLPSHIWCFVGLSNMPTGKEKLSYGGIPLIDGVHAVVEVANYVEDLEEATQSDLFTPLLLDVDGIDDDGDVTGRTFYLANTDAFVGPCCVIPDIGGQNNAYFQVKSRKEWSDLFIDWLKSPHEDDVM